MATTPALTPVRDATTEPQTRIRSRDLLRSGTFTTPAGLRNPRELALVPPPPAALIASPSPHRDVTTPMLPRATCTCNDGFAAASIASRPRGVWLQDATLLFEVSRDEEYVRLRLASEPYSFDMGARVHNYLLLLLARARLADAASSHPESSHGWVYQDDFGRDPTLTDPQINVHIFRVRKQFTERGIVDGDGIIERRPQTRQLRIGVSRISIVTQ